MSLRGKQVMVLGMPLLLFIGIISCFGDDAVGASINPALASIGEAFPNIEYGRITWLYSMPKIVIVPVCLISGFLIGKKVSYKKAAVTGFALIAVGGMAPYFMNEFWQIMFARFVLGIGLGIQAPIGPALVMRFFPDPQKRSTALGIGHGFVNIYGVVTNLLVGSLCTINWHYAFLAYGTIIILLLLTAFFLKNPKDGLNISALSSIQNDRQRRSELAAEVEDSPYKRKPIGFSVIILLAAYFVTLLLWGTAGLNLSAIVKANGFGDAALSGVIISFINLAGVLAGFAFGFIYKFFKQYTLAFGYFLMASGLGLFALAPNAFCLGLGIFIAGLANTILMTGFEAEIGNRVLLKQVSLAMSFCMTASQLSGFFTGFYISFVMGIFGRTNFAAPVACSAIILAIIGIVFIIFGIKTSASIKKRTNEI